MPSNSHCHLKSFVRISCRIHASWHARHTSTIGYKSFTKRFSATICLVWRISLTLPFDVLHYPTLFTINSSIPKALRPRSLWDSAHVVPLHWSLQNWNSVQALSHFRRIFLFTRKPCGNPTISTHLQWALDFITFQYNQLTFHPASIAPFISSNVNQFDSVVVLSSAVPGSFCSRTSLDSSLTPLLFFFDFPDLGFLGFFDDDDDGGGILTLPITKSARAVEKGRILFCSMASKIVSRAHSSMVKAR